MVNMYMYGYSGYALCDMDICKSRDDSDFSKIRLSREQAWCMQKTFWWEQYKECQSCQNCH